jgi:hypothetical protein
MEALLRKIKATPTFFKRLLVYDRIHKALLAKNNQNALVEMYSVSQAEHKRAGKLTMSVGTSREKDLKYLLKHVLGSDFNGDLNDNLSEDFNYRNERFSIKHISDKAGSGGIKLKWTSDNKQARAYINKMLEMNPDDYVHQLIVYIDTKSRKISFHLILAGTVMDGVKKFGEGAFTSATGNNNRGIEFTGQMRQYILSHTEFKVEMTNVTLAEHMHDYRLEILKKYVL